MKKRFPIIFAIVLTLLVAAVPLLAEWLKDMPRFGRMHRDINTVSQIVQEALCWPWGKLLLHPWWRIAVAFPWFLLVGFGLKMLHHKVLKGKYRFVFSAVLLLWIILRIFPDVLFLGENKKPSKSIGTVANGRIEHAKRIPYQGENYRTYSFAGYLAGRTFVHEKVRDVILDAYDELSETLPEQTFVLMETGKRFGGRILPHRTHRNGLSVDFMTPLKKGDEPFVSSGLFNLWAYGRDFDDTGKKDAIAIDYEVMAQHLLAIERSAKKHGLSIQKVIFDPVLRPYLFKSPSGKKLGGRFPFTRNRVVVRHDDHYHIDFRL